MYTPLLVNSAFSLSDDGRSFSMETYLEKIKGSDTIKKIHDLSSIFRRDHFQVEGD